MKDEVLESLGIYSPEDGAMNFNNAVSEIQGQNDLVNWKLVKGRPKGDAAVVLPAPRSSEAQFSYESSGDTLELLYSLRPRLELDDNTPASLGYAEQLDSDIEHFNITLDLMYTGGSEPMFEQLDVAFQDYVGDSPSQSFRTDEKEITEAEFAQALDPDDERIFERPHRRAAFEFDYDEWKKA